MPDYTRPVLDAETRLALRKPRPHVFTKRETKRDKSNRQKAVAMAVSIRDGRCCRCCGRREQLQHHHLRYRSKGGADCTENELLLCAGCHGLIHARQLWILGSNADRHLQFEIHEAAVVDTFGTKPLPKHVRIVVPSRKEA